MLICGLPIDAQQAKKKKKQNNPNSPNPEGPVALNLSPMTIAGEIAGERVGNPEKQGDWPVVRRAPRGQLEAITIGLPPRLRTRASARVPSA